MHCLLPLGQAPIFDNCCTLLDPPDCCSKVQQLSGQSDKLNCTYSAGTAVILCCNMRDLQL